MEIKPDFLKDEEELETQENKMGKPEDQSWGDFLLKDKEELSFRHETLAHMAASGMSNNDIAAALNLTPSRVSVLLTNSRIQARVREIQEKYWGGNIEQRFRASLPKAMDVMEEAISNPYNTFKERERLDAAKWLLEKVTGKAKQEVSVEGNLLGNLLDQIDDMRQRGEIIDITAEKVKEIEESKKEAKASGKKEDGPQFDEWIATNLEAE